MGAELLRCFIVDRAVWELCCFDLHANRNFFRVMDLTQIWSMLIVAGGVSAIDSRRTFISAAIVLLGLLAALALVIARFISN